MSRALASVANRAAVKLHRMPTPPSKIHSTYDNLSPLIFIHGLLASESTYRTIQKRDDFAPYRKKVGIDLRNHGSSPWVPSSEMTYDDMSRDVIGLMDELKLPQAILLGHSMGGKVAMHTALQHADRVEKLIIVDIAPLTYRPTKNEADPSFALDVMKTISDHHMAQISSRTQANDLLKEHGIQSEGVRQFLLTNLRKNDGDNNDTKYQWKTNVEEVVKAMPHLLSFEATGVYNGPTCFIRGGLSKYVPFNAMKHSVQLFPSLKLVTVSQAGHWVQSQQPDQFCQAVNDFIND